jgi:hypothetical protein
MQCGETRRCLGSNQRDRSSTMVGVFAVAVSGSTLLFLFPDVLSWLLCPVSS